jgi:hypothetical protein
MMASIPRLQFFINGISIRYSPSQIFQLFHPFKGYYLSYVLILSCLLISRQVYRCAGICCIISYPLPFKKYVRLAHGRYSHVIAYVSLSKLCQPQPRRGRLAHCPPDPRPLQPRHRVALLAILR